MKSIKTTIEFLHEIEKFNTKFKVYTRISPGDALKFYLAKGRFPKEKEIDAIAYLGIDMALEVWQTYDTIEVPKTIYSELEKLGSAKLRFAEACKQVLRKFFKKI